MLDTTDFNGILEQMLIFVLHIDGNGMVVMDFETLMRLCMFVVDFVVMVGFGFSWFIMDHSTQCDRE